MPPTLGDDVIRTSHGAKAASVEPELRAVARLRWYATSSGAAASASSTLARRSWRSPRSCFVNAEYAASRIS